MRRYSAILTIIFTLQSFGLFAQNCDITHQAIEICKGDNTTLTCTTVADKYEWSTGASGSSSISVSPTTSTTYWCKTTKNGGSVTTGNLVSYGDFEFAPSQKNSYINQTINDPIRGDSYTIKYETYSYNEFKTDGTCDPGNYTTTKNPANIKAPYFESLAPKKGQWMLAVDGKNETKWKVWQVRNLKLKGGQKYEFSCWAANIDKEYITKSHGKASLPKLKFVIEDCSTGGEKDLGPFLVLPEERGVWTKFSAEYTPTIDCDWAHITIYNSTASNEGNDFAIDDIYFGAAKTTEDVVVTECFTVNINDNTDIYITDKVERGKPYNKNGFNISASETKNENQIKKSIQTSSCFKTYLTLNIYGKADTTICYGSTLKVGSMTKGVSYEWNYIGATGDSITIQKADAMQLLCRVNFADGNFSIDTINVTAYARPGKDNPSTYEECTGDGPFFLQIEVNPAPTNYKQYPEKYIWNPTYVWTKNGIFVAQTEEPILDDVYFPKKVGDEDTYINNITNGLCFETVTIILKGKSCPKEPIYHYISECQKDKTISLTPKTEGISYLWSDGSKNRTFETNLKTPGKYLYNCTVTTSDIEGTEQIEYFTLTIHSTEDVALYGSVCAGNPYSKDGFTFTAEETAVAGVLKKERTEQTEQGCEKKVTFTLTVNENPSFEATVKNNSISINVLRGAKPYTFIIDDKTYTTTEIVGVKEGTHIILMKDGNSCTATDVVTIVSYPIVPMVYFSPNGDGINDLWLIENIWTYPDAIIQIFDRYNRLLHTFKGSEFTGWDGTYNGHDMPKDDYWYIINDKEFSKAVSGHFILKR